MSAQKVQELLECIFGPLGTLNAVECKYSHWMHDLKEDKWDALKTHAERWRVVYEKGRMRCIYVLVDRYNKNFYLVMTAAVLRQDNKFIGGLKWHSDE
jgi:hypothetical protein